MLLLGLGTIIIVKKEKMEKKFSELGENFTAVCEQDYEELQKILLPSRIFNIVKDSTNFRLELEDSYLMYNNCNRRCEIRDFKVKDYEKLKDTSFLKEHFEGLVDNKIDIEIEDAYIVNATMEIRYRCDYEDGTLPEEILYKSEPYIYNGFWSDWKTEAHSYCTYKVDGEWYVCGNDDEG